MGKKVRLTKKQMQELADVIAELSAVLAKAQRGEEVELDPKGAVKALPPPRRRGQALLSGKPADIPRCHVTAPATCWSCS